MTNSVSHARLAAIAAASTVALTVLVSAIFLLRGGDPGEHPNPQESGYDDDPTKPVHHGLPSLNAPESASHRAISNASSGSAAPTTLKSHSDTGRGPSALTTQAQSFFSALDCFTSFIATPEDIDRTRHEVGMALERLALDEDPQNAIRTAQCAALGQQYWDQMAALDRDDFFILEEGAMFTHAAEYYRAFPDTLLVGMSAFRAPNGRLVRLMFALDKSPTTALAQFTAQLQQLTYAAQNESK